MANAQKKNAIFVDATGTITATGLKPTIMGILVTPSVADSRVVIKESVSGTVVIDIKIVAVASSFIDFSHIKGIEVTTAFEIATLTNISSVILYGKFNQPVGKAV